MTTLIDELILLRERLSIPQTEVAAACGVDQSTVSLWEREKTKPSGSAKILLERFIAERRVAA